MRIILGVSGGIAAYKAVLLLRMLREAGHAVRVIPTEAALRFVGAPTWEALSGEPVTTSVFQNVDHVEHVALGQSADLVIVAPATADLLARAAAGRADDLLTATLLAARCPVVMAPAMHTEMWNHAATCANVATLRSRGVHVIEPASGRLTGKDTGAGRLPEPQAIMDEALGVVTTSTASPGDLAGTSVVISGGGTREPIDPVRFIGNRSTGKQGVALARAAVERGAAVTLVAANVEVDTAGCGTVIRVESTAELRDAMRAAATEADVVIMSAAVADFRPVTTGASKIKKVPGQGPAPIELVENPDILKELCAERLHQPQVIVGFAAETGDENASVLEHGRTKALRKGADLLAVNAVGGGLGFGAATNEVWVLNGQGVEVTHAAGTKEEVAGAILDAVVAVKAAATSGTP
ncbi:MAG: bifunctional phosphopantothenoylcysteine decarboxylase/phosphopantothenate--cysteine ligase CoaBC [Cellulomonadaceae bacterium]|jgi:phosphopantothenoylcysteine decarboxylase/phosphopantothenate--cysteine ligase|nr:bifunctional phosphopantothenoylcysteine decarboxylase/phosphopantothenate--cysteine ligase CoaBC [Cellulomonadaceae bacterium]